METFELRYFLGVAGFENIHKASEKLNVSPGSLSKAIARLESELEVTLFHREGRGIKLTDHGRILQKRASEIVFLEESTKVELLGKSTNLHVVIAGPEILLSHFGMELSQTIKKKYPRTTFEFSVCSDQEVGDRIQRGEAHLGIISSDADRGLHTKPLGDAHFQTYVGSGHRFHSFSKSGKSHSIEEVLKEPFVSPDNPLLGAVGLKQSVDGWRDDKFPRLVHYRASSLKVLENIVVSGLAIAYLPDYFASQLSLQKLKITGCPYVCEQKIKLVMRNPKEIGWINQVF